jgi:hypothetical protein
MQFGILSFSLLIDIFWKTLIQVMLEWEVKLFLNYLLWKILETIVSFYNFFAKEQLLENPKSVEIVEQVNPIENPLPSTSRQVDQNSLRSTSRQVNQQHMNDLNSESSTSEFVVSPKDIVPIPKCQSKTNQKTKKRFYCNNYRQPI